MPLADPHQNEKIEKFEYNGYHITNFEMESSALASLSRLMGHKAMTVCMVIANRLDKRSEHGIQKYDRYSYQNSTRPYLSILQEMLHPLLQQVLGAGFSNDFITSCTTCPLLVCIVAMPAMPTMGTEAD